MSRSTGHLLQGGIKLRPLRVGLFVSRDLRRPGQTGRQPAWAGADNGRRLPCICQSPEPSGAQCRADFAFLDAVDRQTQDVRNDLGPEQRPRATADQIDFAEMRARGCQGHKIVAGGEGNAFQNGLYDVGSARIGPEPDKGAARLGVIQGRAFTRKIREELDRESTAVPSGSSRSASRALSTPASQASDAAADSMTPI